MTNEACAIHMTIEALNLFEFMTFFLALLRMYRELTNHGHVLMDGMYDLYHQPDPLQPS